MVSTHKVVGDVAEAGLSRMVGTMALILPAVALLQVLANAHDYRQPAAVIAVTINPTAKRDFLANVVATQFAAGVSSQHGLFSSMFW